ncbi:MAG: 50S ribosomal protein L32 [Armatimonadetes bacterium]|nr:50S ribosomal protein L32 [Armatimonadota bacterium]
MAVPKRKTSKARRRARFAHWKIDAVSTIRCRSCGGRKQPHAACPYCGQHKGRAVIEPRVESNS